MDIVTIPVVWMTYQVQGSAVSILGGTVSTPPQIVMEHLVAKGLAKRLGTVSTFEAKAIENEEEDDTPDTGNLWMKDD